MSDYAHLQTLDDEIESLNPDNTKPTAPEDTTQTNPNISTPTDPREALDPSQSCARRAWVEAGYITPAPREDTVVVEDEKTPVEIIYSLPDSSPPMRFAVKFSARKVHVDDASVSVVMNKVISLELPIVPVTLTIKVRDVRHTVAYAGGMIPFGNFLLIPFVRIKN